MTLLKTWIIGEDISFASSKVILLFTISPDSMTSSYIANKNTRFSNKKSCNQYACFTVVKLDTNFLILTWTTGKHYQQPKVLSSMFDLCSRFKINFTGITMHNFQHQACYKLEWSGVSRLGECN